MRRTVRIVWLVLIVVVAVALVPFRVTQVFVLHLCHFLHQEDLMEREAMVQNP